MYKATVLHHPPRDPAEFDRYYDEVHVPLAHRLPGLRRYTITRPEADADGTAPAFHLVAVLEFDDKQAFTAAIASPEGQAAEADMANFTHAGVTILAGVVTQI